MNKGHGTSGTSDIQNMNASEKLQNSIAMHHFNNNSECLNVRDTKNQSSPTTRNGSDVNVHPLKNVIYVNIPIRNATSGSSSSLTEERFIDVEELLSICTEYDKQNSSDNCTRVSAGPHITKNRIKTNGSLPRDRKLNVQSPAENYVESPSVSTPEKPKVSAHSPDLSLKSNADTSGRLFPNSEIVYTPQSPRTKIRTRVTSNKANESDEYDTLIHEFEKKLKQEIKSLKESTYIKEASVLKDEYAEDKKCLLNMLTNRRENALEDVRILKRKISELQCEEDEIFRDLDLEEALLTAELTTENIAIRNLEQDLGKVQNQIYRLEAQRNANRVMQETQQAKLKQAINLKVNQIESLQQITQGEETIQEELERLSESLDNDRKMFEDLEFQYLEEESEWLSKREELLMRLKLIKKRIVKMKSHTDGLQQQTYCYQKMACDDTKGLEHDLLSLIQELEQKREFLKEIDKQIIHLHNGSTSIATKNHTDWDNKTLSESLILWESANEKIKNQNIMSKSFNENMLLNNIEGLNSSEKTTDSYNGIDPVPSNDFAGYERGCDWDEAPTRDESDSASVGPVAIHTSNRIQNDKRWSSPDILNNGTAEKTKQSNGIQQSRIPVYKSTNVLRIPSVSRHLARDRSISESDSAEGMMSSSSSQPAKHQRPLTRYLPTTSFNLNLRHHIESAGHQIALCPHVFVDESTCKGYLHKLGATFKSWSKRWFVLNRTEHAFVYYTDKSEKRARGGAYFSAIDEVYLDHLNGAKSDRPNCTFVVKTKKRLYQLQAASSAAARIWIDAIMTGALGSDDLV